MNIIERLWIAHGELPGRQLLMRDAMAEIQTLRKVGHELARAADTAELLLRETCPAEAQSLRANVAAWIELETSIDPPKEPSAFVRALDQARDALDGRKSA